MVHVALFVTCLVDLWRPSVGFAAVKLLEDAGCRVSVPAAQTCCAQPAYNSGDRKDAVAIAGNVIAAFEGFDYVVAPSGSCAGMIKCHYPGLFADDPDMLALDHARTLNMDVPYPASDLARKYLGQRRVTPCELTDCLRHF